MRADLLSGMRVVELAGDRALLCGRYLADLGADVLLVEPPGGAPLRTRPPFHGGESLAFATAAANKRVTTVDLADPAGPARLHELLADADVLLETGAPGDLAAAGLDPGELRARHPQLIVASVSEFGQDGPYRDLLGNDWVQLALGTALCRSGEPGARPVMPPAGLADASVSAQAAWAVVVAWWRQLQSGAGARLDISAAESVLQVLDPAFGTGGTAAAGRRWHDLPSGRPDVGHYYPVLACADGNVRLAVLSPRQWRGLRSWLGEPEQFQDPAFDLVHKRFGAVDELYPLIRSLFAPLAVAEAVAEGQRRGVPIVPVLSPGDVLDEAHYESRGAFAGLELADGARATVPSGFVEVDGLRAGIEQAARSADEPATWAPRDRPAPAAYAPERPLSGLRVLDLGVIVLGAEAGRLFADLGAEVVKVENRAFPDSGRTAIGTEMTTSFAWGNRNKLGLGLNLRSPEGVALFKRLVEQSDVVLSNFKPGTLESLGIGWSDLAAVNPRIVVASSSAFGHTGPWQSWMGYGPLVRAATGLTDLWRPDAGSAAYGDAATVFPDHHAARILATAALAGVARARRTGRGCHVQSSQAEAILTALSAEFAHESLQPGSFVPRGRRAETDAPWAVLRCSGEDEWCVVTVRGDTDFARLCEVMKAPELAGDARFAGTAERLRHVEELEQLVEAWTSARSPRQVMEELQAAGVPAAAMLRPVDLATDEQLRHRDFWAALLQPGIGDALPAEARPFASPDLPDPAQQAAPLHGQHTRQVMADVLGLDDTTLDGLVEGGVLETVDPWRPVRKALRKKESA